MRYCFQWLNVDSMIMWQKHTRTHARMHARTHTHTHTHLTALFPGLPGWAGTRKVKQSGFYWSKRQWVAVASAGPYASLHLAPERQPHQHPTTQFFTGRMPCLLPNQQCQSTEGRHKTTIFLNFTNSQFLLKSNATIRYCSTTIENNWQ